MLLRNGRNRRQLIVVFRQGHGGDNSAAIDKVTETAQGSIPIQIV